MESATLIRSTADGSPELSIPFTFKLTPLNLHHGDLAHESCYLRVALRPGTRAHGDFIGNDGDSLLQRW